jgi:hypothetical protein
MLHSYGHEASEWPQLYQQDPDFTTTYQLLGTCTNVTNFHIQDGLLCHLGHLCVPTSEHAKMIWEAHYSRMEGHFGMEKIVVILQKHFYWPKLRQDINKYIISCTSCAISKPTIKKQGLYTPLPTPKRPWESISMDYMSGLPSTKQGNDCVFVVVDQFLKMAILTTCKKSITVDRYCQDLLRMGVGPFWDTTDHHLRSGQQVPQHILVESLVTVGHQAH